MHPCPAGHYCPGGNESHPGIPQPCPEHTFLAAEGGQSLAACLPCPAGYQCPSPGEDAEPSGESREVTWQPQAAGFLASAFAQVSLPLKTTHALQATGVQVVRVPFSAHLAPFGQSQEPRHGKTVSTVPPATTAQGLSRAAGQACLRSPAALDLNVLQVGPQPLALLAPPLPPTSALSFGQEAGGRLKALPGHLSGLVNHLPSPPRPAQAPKTHPVWLGLVHLDSETEGLSLFLSPQVLWLRPPAGLAPTAGPRLGSPRSAPEAMPAPPAPPPTLARGSCECHPSSCQS